MTPGCGDYPLCLLTLGGFPLALSVARILILTLTTDGGGIRGVSELKLLVEIMDRVKNDEKLDSDPCPANYFDMIGGTSTRGIIALLLGRLR
jgi:patatin-like phospholipase/acyl hydrolase